MSGHPEPAPPDAGQREAVARAEALARDLAPSLSSVLITHFPDVETLDTLRPGESDLALAAAVNRAVAAALTEAGVEVFVQPADRALFRRWMDERTDTPANRLAWRNRGNLLRRAAALELLGLDARKLQPPVPAKSSLSPADRLVRAFAGEDDRAFRRVAETLILEERGGVLGLAARKLAERYGEEAAEDLELELLQVAEAADIGPSGWATLVALPVALPPDSLPDAGALAGSLLASGVLGEALELRFLPEWRSATLFEALEPVMLRKALAEMVAGGEPAGLPPADPAELTQRGFGVLLGVQFDWGLPTWEDLAENGLPPAAQPAMEGVADEPEQETSEEAEFRVGFDRWRMAVSEAVEGCVPLALIAPSDVVEEIDDFLGEAGFDTSGIEEIRDFVEMARREAGEEVVCRPEVIGEALELSLYTRAGRFLDSLTLPPERLPMPAVEMPRVIQGFVPLLRDVPGR
ncbi:hypothetical protein D9599_20405 [Roseomonas sp. KE2513]|uniref:hypothetical protein n=1 Tax=Roseomonas sp. KE2513 TaxID=2479202 RepID=UPI0018DFD3F8|nr:hypothetical protein [Roseomonas sp. KE2513]MBI0537926.1 hypothetical protein [Roseomonas sp. KE2513]